MTRYTLVLLFTFITGISAQNPARITTASMDVKRNGVFIRLRLTQPVQPEHITGWISKGWFYITILGAQTDSIQLSNVRTTFPIKDIVSNNSAESTQISLRLAKNVERFEFYQSSDPPEILVTLYFPIEDILTALQEEKQSMHIPEQRPGKKRKAVYGLRYTQLRNALYLIGTSLTIAGILDQDKTDAGSSWELSAGLSVLSLTYGFDKWIYPKIHND